MRKLVPAIVLALFAPLSACYVGNTPPVSRRADAATTQPAEDAGANEDAAVEEDAATPEDAAPERPVCERDEDCGDDARCVTDRGAVRCELLPRDAGTPDAGRPVNCQDLCRNQACGVAYSPECGEVECAPCPSGYSCGANQCVWEGAYWAVTVVSARVDRCDTSWDQCPHGGQPLCSPSLPDPFVRFAGVITTPAGNRCEGTYNAPAGTFEEPRLTAGVAFVLEDDDSVIANVRTGDVVCRGTLTVTPLELAAGTKTVTCEGGSVTFSFTRRR